MADTKRFRPKVASLAVILAACLVSVASPARAMLIAYDNSRIEDPATRVIVAIAIKAVQKNPTDRPAMEILLKTLPEVVDTIGITAIYNFQDPLKTDACKLIQGGSSVDALVDATAGSDLMARYACRKILLQSWNSDSRNLKAIGGIIDDAAKAKLRVPALHVLDRKNSAARAAAVYALGAILPADERITVLKPLLKDEDLNVAAAAVRDLGQFGIYDEEIDGAVWKLLCFNEDPNLVAACCQWWWVDRQRHNHTITGEQEARFAQLVTASDPAVRREVAEAVGEYATAAHPVLVSLLLKIATSDEDEIARYRAVYSLRHAKTRDVYASLVKFAQDPQPLVSRSAQQVLSEERWDPAKLEP